MKSTLISSIFLLMSFGVGVFQVNASDERLVVFSSPSGEILIGIEDIMDVEVAAKESNSALTIYLNKKASEALGNLTERSIGHHMNFAVCGEIIVSPVVRSPISSGMLTFYGLPIHQAKKILNTMNGNNTCAQW